MASTKPSDIASLSHDGDTDLTPITNEMAATRGFPMELSSGGVVNIVSRKQIGGGRLAFTATDGTVYVQEHGHTGKLVILAEGGDDPEPAAEEATEEAPEAPAAEETPEEQPETEQEGQQEERQGVEAPAE